MLRHVQARLAEQVTDIDVEDALDMAQALLKQRPSARNTLYVLPDEETPGPNRMRDGSALQPVAARCMIVLALRSRRQGEQVDLVKDWKDQVHGALLGWKPPGMRESLAYAGGNLLNLDDGTVWYGQRYETEFILESKQ